MTAESQGHRRTPQGNLWRHTAASALDTYGHLTEQMQRNTADRIQRGIEEAHKSG